ncbi:hypothetical protein [Caenispirillum bisanense]|uniref:hypothetical protein n=1 Tax=Caenispirillum bisanense TaxID=414052 RepID=UPI0031DE4D57
MTRRTDAAGPAEGVPDAGSTADQLLGTTRRTTALTLEAALSRVRPLRRDMRDRFDWRDDDMVDDEVISAAFDMMALSRLSLRSAERLNGVVAALVSGGAASTDADGGGHAGH